MTELITRHPNTCPLALGFHPPHSLLCISPALRSYSEGDDVMCVAMPPSWSAAEGLDCPWAAGGAQNGALTVWATANGRKAQTLR
eukprot:6090081-Pleurochrysis_carterae.AAC.4